MSFGRTLHRSAMLRQTQQTRKAIEAQTNLMAMQQAQAQQEAINAAYRQGWIDGQNAMKSANADTLGDS